MAREAFGTTSPAQAIRVPDSEDVTAASPGVPEQARVAAGGRTRAVHSLRGHRSFAAYLSGEAASLLGTSPHAVALPALAVLVLDAHPGQIAVLAILAQAPAFVLALPAGALVDRHAKKPILIGSDLVAATAVTVIPLTAATGLLTLPVLYGVALVVGSATVLHQAAAIAVVPELVAPPLLQAANARIGGAFSLADSVGAYAGAGLVAVLGAVRAFWLDALSYAVSAWCATRIRLHHRAPAPRERERLGPAIRRGLVFVARTPVVRPLVLALALTALGTTVIEVYRAYYLLTVLDAEAFGLGVVMGSCGAGGLLGALAAPRLVTRFGPGPVMISAFGLHPVLGTPLLVAQSGPGWLTVLALADAAQTAAATCAGTTQRSVRQQSTPPGAAGAGPADIDMAGLRLPSIRIRDRGCPGLLVLAPRHDVDRHSRPVPPSCAAVAVRGRPPGGHAAGRRRPRRRSSAGVEVRRLSKLTGTHQFLLLVRGRRARAPLLRHRATPAPLTLYAATPPREGCQRTRAVAPTALGRAFPDRATRAARARSRSAFDGGRLAPEQIDSIVPARTSPPRSASAPCEGDRVLRETVSRRRWGAPHQRCPLHPPDLAAVAPSLEHLPAIASRLPPSIRRREISMDASHEAAPAGPQPRMSHEDYARSRHAVWLSAAALVTDRLGRVLLVKPTYREQWLLPGGGAEPGDSPAQACRRELGEELGLPLAPGRLLAVHWLPPDHPDIVPGMPVPGEVRYIFDGGTLTEEEITGLRLPAEELAGYEFTDSTQLERRMIPVDARITLAALRARLSGTTAHLEGGHHVGETPPLDRHEVRVRPRSGRTCPWHTSPVPAHLKVRQALGWLFLADGRVVVVVDPGKRLPTLPGGTVEMADASPESGLHRESMEEAQLTLGGDVVRLGWVYDATGEVYGGTGPCARLRLAAPITSVGPAAVDPATGRTFARLLTTPAQAAALLGWGEQGYQQADLAARLAEERWGIPRAAPSPITELHATS